MPQRISSFDHYIERSGDLKLNTLMKKKTRETSNPKRSPEIPDEREHSRHLFAILMGRDGGNRPLGEREAVERS
jgi:hypothetical protein